MVRLYNMNLHMGRKSFRNIISWQSLIPFSAHRTWLIINFEQKLQQFFLNLTCLNTFKKCLKNAFHRIRKSHSIKWKLCVSRCICAIHTLEHSPYRKYTEYLYTHCYVKCVLSEFCSKKKDHIPANQHGIKQNVWNIQH